jgi:hypothetical protein
MAVIINNKNLPYCKYFKLAEKNYGTCRYFSNYPFSVYTNDYCSWGEKKE